MNGYYVILIVSASLFVIGQIVYQIVVTKVKREMRETRRRLMRPIKIVRRYQADPFRPELDIDLGVKKVDKLRFGDEE